MRPNALTMWPGVSEGTTMMTMTAPYVSLALGGLLFFVTAGSAEELALGPLRIGLGASEATVIAALKKEFIVREIPGGWSAEPRARKDLRAPAVSITTKDGRIHSASFTWGPKTVTPTLEEMARQLASAFPAKAQCDVENVARPFEGGMALALQFHCGGTIIMMSNGLHAQGNTASIEISLAE